MSFMRYDCIHILVIILSFLYASTALRCNPSCPDGLVCVVSESNKTKCVSDPCAEGFGRCNGNGLCITTVLDAGVTFRCECRAGYTGKDCDSFSSTNGCYRSPCLFSGVCIPLNEEEYSCSCEGTGHFGRHCEIEDLCATNPCINGVCELISIGNTRVTSRRCRCRPGFTGENCENDINECDSSPCHNGMQCENLAGSYRCHCSALYTGLNCSVPIREMCSPETCLNRGNCRVGVHGPICECFPGWSGEFCQFDVDECRTRTCQNGGTCLDQFNGTSCLCLPGWTGPNCEIDINECISPLAGDLCKNNGDCINVNGSYYCVCPIGYAGSDCSTVLNMCDSKANLSCLNGGRCKSEIGYYRCECPNEWQGTYCELRNPCAKNPCRNGGSCRQLFDHPERHTCYCRPGFTGPECGSDIDECQLNPCDKRARCENTIGSFTCHCPPGLTGQFCSETAIFNCTALQPCSNGGTCVSKIGSYGCLCRNGFSGLNCEINDDDCASNPCLNSGTCIDGVGTHKCLCPASFTGPRCESLIDSCASDPNYCYHGGRCVTVNDNLGKSQSKCQCLPGFIGQRCEANVNECASKPCNSQGTSSCIDLIGDYSCLCYPGFTGRRCETQMDALQSVRQTPAECSDSCVLRFGDGRCDADCNIRECKYDGGDCVANFNLATCSPHCEAVFANGKCDPVCNRKGCLWDGNDCLLDPYDLSRYITGIVATYSMSCRAFHSESSLLLYNLSSLVGAVTREEPKSVEQNLRLQTEGTDGDTCQVELMFDKKRCSKDGCPKTAEEFIEIVEDNPKDYTPGQLVNNNKPEPGSGPSRDEIIVASIVGGGALLASALILACVLGKRVRAKTWFPPGFFDALRLSDQNTGHLPSKQRKISSSTTASTSATPSSVLPTTQGTFFDPTGAMFTGTVVMTPPDRREQDLVDPPGPDGLTPLMLACSSAHLSNPPQRVCEIILQLIQRGANPLAKTVQREETALHLAARYRNTVAVRVLMDYCPDVNVRDAEGKTPLHSAIGADAQDCMRWLLRHRLIHIDARMLDGTTPLILATRLCLNSLVTDLVRCNAKLDTQDSLGRTALHWAAAVDNVEAIHLLGRHGADKDAQDAREQTPLFLSCREGNRNSVIALLEMGAQRDLADHADVSPRQAATDAGYRQIVRLLDEFMIDPNNADQPGTSAILNQLQHQRQAQSATLPRSAAVANPGPSIKVEAASSVAVYQGPSSTLDKGQKLFVDLPPPYTEKPSVTPGADMAASHWSKSSAKWKSQPVQSGQSGSGATISPQQNGTSGCGLPENFLTPSPDNHSSTSSTSPPNNQHAKSANEVVFAVGVPGSSYGTQPRQSGQRRQQRPPVSQQGPQFQVSYSVERGQTQYYPTQYAATSTTPYGPGFDVVQPGAQSNMAYYSQQAAFYQPQQQPQQVQEIVQSASQSKQTPTSDPVYF